MADNSPTSVIDIVNLALTELKVDTLESLDQEGSEIAELSKRHYDIVRKSILRSHVWNFAKAEAALARASTGSSASFDDVYPLPKTYIRLISVGDVLVWTKREDIDIRSISIEGSFVRSIVIDNNGAATLDIIFIRNVTVVTEFDPLFITLLKFELAMALANGVTIKPSLKRGIREQLADARLQARSIDGQERPPVKTQRSRFLGARRTASRSRPAIRTNFGS